MSTGLGKIELKVLEALVLCGVVRPADLPIASQRTAYRACGSLAAKGYGQLLDGPLRLTLNTPRRAESASIPEAERLAKQVRDSAKVRFPAASPPLASPIFVTDKALDAASNSASPEVAARPDQMVVAAIRSAGPKSSTSPVLAVAAPPQSVVEVVAPPRPIVAPPRSAPSSGFVLQTVIPAPPIQTRHTGPRSAPITTEAAMEALLRGAARPEPPPETPPPARKKGIWETFAEARAELRK
jgi:hypothetical protein